VVCLYPPQQAPHARRPSCLCLICRPLASSRTRAGHHPPQRPAQLPAISDISVQSIGPCCRSSRRSAGTPLPSGWYALCTRAARPPRPPLAPWADPRLRTRQHLREVHRPSRLELSNCEITFAWFVIRRPIPPLVLSESPLPAGISAWLSPPSPLPSPSSPAGSSRHSKHGRPRKSGSACLHMLRPRVSSEHMWLFTQFTRAARHTFPSLSTFTYSKLVNARPFFANASLYLPNDGSFAPQVRLVHRVYERPQVLACAKAAAAMFTAISCISSSFSSPLQCLSAAAARFWTLGAGWTGLPCAIDYWTSSYCGGPGTRCR
jgi:hypothetical protein